MKKLGTPGRLAVLLAAVALVVVTAAAAAPKNTAIPDRIVSLSPSSTDDLFAIGAGKQVVAVDSYSTYPKQAPTTKLSAYTPNVEAIAKYKPDLVVLSGDTNHIAEQLAKVHIKSIIEPAAANLSGVYTELKQLGTVTGHPAGAKAVVARMQQQIKAIVASVPRPTTPFTVYHELDQTYYSATSHTFIGQLYTLLGLKNIADKAGGASDYPQLSDEYIIASDPDLIVLADTVCCGQTLATVKARPGWNTITAVKRSDVVAINDSIASQWGTRVVSFLKAIASGLKTLEAQSK